jgi:hypothetical protein
MDAVFLTIRVVLAVAGVTKLADREGSLQAMTSTASASCIPARPEPRQWWFLLQRGKTLAKPSVG